MSKREILENFFKRRNTFNAQVSEKNIQIFTCPCCGYPTLKRRGLLDFCSLCTWEDDGQDDIDAREIKGGANGALSLEEGRLKIGTILEQIKREEGGVLNMDINEVIEALSKREESLRSLIEEKRNKSTKPDNSFQEEYRRLEKDSLKSLLKI